MKPPVGSHSIFDAFLVPRFRAALLSWYDEHRRDLPWRQTRDPYRVWLSEIMLQQTRVAAVIGHYREFLRRFPTVEKLAGARESSVLAAWSGLGYYRRARMLHKAARMIVRQREFPQNAGALRSLPGVGRYTAAAIASIAFDEPVAVVDGNVERVLQRIFGHALRREEFWTAAGELLDPQRPGDFNQAMMELGAVVCTPRSPGCLTCPVNGCCATRGELERGPKPARQKKQIHFALHSRENSVFLIRRPQNASLMPGMWELPSLEESEIEAGKEDLPTRLIGRRNNKSERANLSVTLKLRHAITVTDYTVRVHRRAAPPKSEGKWVALERISKLALTGLARKILRKAEIV